MKRKQKFWWAEVKTEFIVCALPVPDWHKELLSERMAAYKKGELKTIPMAELRRRLRVK